MLKSGQNTKRLKYSLKVQFSHGQMALVAIILLLVATVVLRHLMVLVEVGVVEVRVRGAAVARATVETVIALRATTIILGMSLGRNCLKCSCTFYVES